MATLAQIAEWVAAEPPSVGIDIGRVSSIEQASADSLVFAMDTETLQRALQSAAGAILANVRQRSAELSANAHIVWVADPRYAFSLVAKKLSPKAADGSVHPSAVVSSNVAIGRGTQIGPGAVLEEGVQVGEDCILGPRVVLHTGTILGDRVVVQAGTVLGSTGFGYARNNATGEYLLFPQQGTLVIEDDVEIGANTLRPRPVSPAQAS